MSFFGVTVETIEKIYPHPNADRLELGRVSGMSFQFVVGKGSYTPGDKVLYFPVDSLLTTELATKLGLAGLVPDRDHQRIKTIKLCGEISQGFVYPFYGGLLPEGLLGEDNRTITAYLGVEKYEAPPAYFAGGELLPLPEGLSVYDIEGCERNPDVVKYLMDKKVIVTEKVEGLNFSVMAYSTGEVKVNSRNKTIVENEGQHTFWNTARDNGIISFAKSLLSAEDIVVCVYGEIIGPKIQGNYYGLKDYEVRIFDIKYLTNEREGSYWADHHSVMAHCLRGDMKMVPTLSMGRTLREYLDGKTVVEISNGKSEINLQKLREGIVIKAQFPLNGRVITKQRDPIYLAKTGA